MSEFHKDDIIFSAKHGEIARIKDIIDGGIYKIVPLGSLGFEFFSDELKIEEIESVHITSDFLESNSLYCLINQLELYPFHSTNDGCILYKLEIDYNEEGDKFHVQTVGKIKYVHELQQYLREHGLKEIADNLKIGE
jgi:hypothetical protein